MSYLDMMEEIESFSFLSPSLVWVLAIRPFRPLDGLYKQQVPNASERRYSSGNKSPGEKHVRAETVRLR
ncbi:hypothetical protein CEXT_95321 [Caerostris extrusa]|uniref:Uncharacterized protein n=1 Tax=Caerostris extrusa TaxID=172846 RepID=A0AAV4XSE7_CAEEX|nr:hypothetical protein CEXT_95321 [Caerostris extrusa]